MCGVSVLCIAATGGRVGGMGVCVWHPPVGAGAETEAEKTQPGKGQRSVCVGGAGRGWWGWVVCGRCEGPCVCVGGLCVWCGRHGCVRVASACGCGDREAERHSQAKDNAVCVCVCVCGVGGMGVCVWRAPVDAGLGGRGQRQRPRDTARQRTTKCVWGWRGGV